MIMAFVKLKNISNWDMWIKGMGQLVKNTSYASMKSQVQIPRAHIRLLVVICVSKPSAPMQRWQEETEDSLEGHSPVKLV